MWQPITTKTTHNQPSRVKKVCLQFHASPILDKPHITNSTTTQPIKPSILSKLRNLSKHDFLFSDRKNFPFLDKTCITNSDTRQPIKPSILMQLRKLCFSNLIRNKISYFQRKTSTLCLALPRIIVGADWNRLPTNRCFTAFREEPLFYHKSVFYDPLVTAMH